MKRIVTPDWVDAASATPVLPSPATDNALNLLASHQRMELFESRIQSGSDARYKHPAQAREEAKIELNPTLTNEELEKSDRYREVKISPIVPGFWPPRSWDSCVLGDEMTEKLRSEIAEMDKLLVFDRLHGFPRASGRIRRCGSVSPRRERLNSVVRLYESSFATDNEDETDWGDF
jgi:hypothetical protein